MDMRLLCRLIEQPETLDRLERAHLLGFDTTRVWYHGTTGNSIEAFDPDFLGRNTGAKSAQKGFFFASDPKVAEGYGRHETYMLDASRPHYDRYQQRIAEIDALINDWHEQYYLPYATKKAALWDRLTTGPKKKRISQEDYWRALDDLERSPEAAAWQAGNDDIRALYAEKTDLEKRCKSLAKTGAISRAVVHPVYLKMLNPLRHDMGGESYREVSYNDLLIKARRGRRDGLIIQNTTDPGYRGAGHIVCDIAVVFTPQQIRSTMARFDLDKAGSPNIGD